MARYRASWKNDSNGWNYRLDILPYDDTLAGSITTLDAGTVIEIGAMKMAFDELPFGLMDAPTFEVTLNWSALPSALQTRLMNKTSGNDRNVFLFWTDRGTLGGTYSLEFCGTQANEESADYDLINPEDLANETYTVTYELIDCMHHMMASYSGASIFDGSLYAASDGTKHQAYFEYLEPAVSSSYYDVALSNDVSYFNLSTWAHCMARLRTSLSNVLNGDYARTTNATELSDADGADSTLEWDTLVETGAVFYARDINGNAASALTSSTAYLATHVVGPDGVVRGGLWDDKDEYGWYQATAIIDLMRDLCETFGVKASYYPTYVADAGGDFIRYTWNIAAVGDSTDGFTSAATVLLTKATSIGTISEGGTTIEKCETRYDLNSARYNYDITEYVAIDNRSRSTRSINFEPIVHNVPSYKPKVRGTQGLRENGLTQTNRITSLLNGKALKAHEQTVVNLSNLSGIAYTSTFVETKPVFTQSDDGDMLADNGLDNALYTAWLNTAQQAASPAAVAEAMLEAFSSQFQTSIEVTYPLAYSANVQPHRFGYVHSLSGGPQAVFTHLPWSRACITSMDVDYTAGTNTITYVLVKLT